MFQLKGRMAMLLQARMNFLKRIIESLKKRLNIELIL